MKKLLKLFSIILGSIIGIFIIAYVGVVILSNLRINKEYSFIVNDVDIPVDSESIARGEHVSIIRGCIDCHSHDLSGEIFIDDPAMGTLYGTNLTGGNGGIPNYSDEDWIRSIRHGVGSNGKPLLFMPSHEYYHLNDKDLGDLIAYLKSINKVDKTFPEHKIGLLGRTLHLAGKFPLLPAELIDHNAKRPIAIEPGTTIEYGKYMAVGCIGCHGNDLKGGKIVGVPPDWPPAADLTKSGNLSNWTKDEFILAMRTGNKPKNEMFSEFMPYEAIGQATDEELTAMWLYVNSLH